MAENAAYCPCGCGPLNPDGTCPNEYDETAAVSLRPVAEDRVAAPWRYRVVFVPWTAPDGQVQTFTDDVLSEDEKVEFENGWLHVVTFDQFGSREWLRSYPAHTVAAVNRG